jgi:hypothetical protein
MAWHLRWTVKSLKFCAKTALEIVKNHQIKSQR